MKVKIEISTDNAAFHNSDGEETWDSMAFEVSRILKELSHRLLIGAVADPHEVTLMDINGNSVGKCQFVDEED